jgi:hypothetical protein
LDLLAKKLASNPLTVKSLPRYLAKTNLLMDTDVRLYGQLEKWPSKAEMVRLMETAGFSVYVGRYSIRLQDCENFTFQEYGGDLGAPQFDAEASSLEKMLEDGGRVSVALTVADIRHRFELYSDNDEMIGYLHHRWPQDKPDGDT